MRHALTAAFFAVPQTMQAKQYASNGVHINNEAHSAYSVVTIAEVSPQCHVLMRLYTGSTVTELVTFS